jgi:hypothetical protein
VRLRAIHARPLSPIEPQAGNRKDLTDQLREEVDRLREEARDNL